MASTRRKPNLLDQRLEEARQQGREIRVQMADGECCGIPIFLDAEFVELVNFYVPEAEDDAELEAEPYERTVWLIRLAEIVAIAYASDSWSKQDFEQLLNPPEVASETED